MSAHSLYDYPYGAFGEPQRTPNYLVRSIPHEISAGARPSIPGLPGPGHQSALLTLPAHHPLVSVARIIFHSGTARSVHLTLPARCRGTCRH